VLKAEGRDQDECRGKRSCDSAKRVHRVRDRRVARHRAIALHRQRHSEGEDAAQNGAERQEHSHAVERLANQDRRRARRRIGDRLRDKEWEARAGEPRGAASDRGHRDQQHADRIGDAAVPLREP
jgi:hypothetical protein